MSRPESAAAVDRAFLEHAPRPKTRKTASTSKRWSPDVILTVYEDPARQLALVRGKNVGKILELEQVAAVARWSPSAKGFVVPLDALADVYAWCEQIRAWCKTKQVEAPG